jgi:hypothetical protein
MSWSQPSPTENLSNWEALSTSAKPVQKSGSGFVPPSGLQAVGSRIIEEYFFRFEPFPNLPPLWIWGTPHVLSPSLETGIAGLLRDFRGRRSLPSRTSPFALAKGYALLHRNRISRQRGCDFPCPHCNCLNPHVQTPRFYAGRRIVIALARLYPTANRIGARGFLLFATSFNRRRVFGLPIFIRFLPGCSLVVPCALKRQILCSRSSAF